MDEEIEAGSRMWAIRRISDGLYFSGAYKDNGWRPLDKGPRVFRTLGAALGGVSGPWKLRRMAGELELVELETRATGRVVNVAEHTAKREAEWKS